MSSLPPKLHRVLVEHYERCLEQHGDSHLGVDWPKADDAATRYRTMLEVVRPGSSKPIELLDFGCGAGHLLEYLRKQPIPGLTYLGLDASPKFIDLCHRKFPGVAFFCRDVLNPDAEVPACDYAVMNGVFTEKREMSFDEMFAFWSAVLSKVFAAARVGVAFNVMSTQVDWERDDLFHLPLDRMAHFLTHRLSRHFVVRNDYGLYEYTVYLYKEATGHG